MKYHYASVFPTVLVHVKDVTLLGLEKMLEMF